MNETYFSINDLMRRKLQTASAIICIALCVASTVFLLLLGNKLGLGLFSIAEDRLTVSFSTVFSRFMIFDGLLIFVAGAAIIAFLTFTMMSQRARDIGLMKATGCPSDLVFGYFANELVIVILAGCLIGLILGIIADYASIAILSSAGIQAMQEPVNFWLILIVFVLYLAFSLISGLKPIFDATKAGPIKALSPSFAFGLNKESDFKGVSKAGLTAKLAIRSLFRHRSATLRIIVCLTAVFTLMTVSIAGGIIADQTTENWIEKAVGRNVVVIAHHDLCDQYGLLLSEFYETKERRQFNYTDDRYQIPEDIVSKLESITDLTVDPRLMVEAPIREVQGIILGEETHVTTYVGDSRKGASLIVGVDPVRVVGQWFTDGEFLKGPLSEAVIGDVIAREMFSEPLYQRVSLFGENFNITGVCVDAINNGNVTYVPLKALQNITGVSKSNVVLAKIGPSAKYSDILEQIRAVVKAASTELEILELNDLVDKSMSFLGHIWFAIMILPILSLCAVILCLANYVALAINEQRQEFGILRALGARPRDIARIIFTQNSLISLSAYAVGIGLGVMATLIVLVPEPLVTSITAARIAGWLSVAFVATLAPSLYISSRVTRKPIPEVLQQS